MTGLCFRVNKVNKTKLAAGEAGFLIECGAHISAVMEYHCRPAMLLAQLRLIDSCLSVTGAVCNGLYRA